MKAYMFCSNANNLLSRKFSKVSQGPKKIAYVFDAANS